MAKTKVADNQMGRILALLKHEQLTSAEIQARLYMSKSAVDRFLLRMTQEKPKRVYVVRVLDNACRPLRVYAAGSKKDAVYIPLDQRGARRSIEVEADRKRAQVLVLLALPQTAAELAARLDMGLSQVKRYLREHHQASPKRVYVKSWRWAAASGSQARIYATGNSPDAPRTRQPRIEVRRRAQPVANHNNAWAAALGV
jgi:AraC-like DNA-binding protein